MQRSEDISIPFVEPDSPVSGGAHWQAARRLVEGGWDAADADWLATLLLRVLPPCGSDAGQLSDTTEGHILLLAMTRSEPLNADGGRDTALLLILAALTGSIWIPRIVVPGTGPDQHDDIWSIPQSEVAEVIAEMRRHGADFELVLRSGWPVHLVSEWSKDRSIGRNDRATAFMKLLLGTRAINLANVIDIEVLRQAGRGGHWWPAGFSLDNNGMQWLDGTPWLDSRSIRTWVWHVGLEPISLLATMLPAEPDETIVSVVTAVAQAATTRFANSEYGCQFEIFEGLTPEWQPTLRMFGRALRPYFEELDRRIVWQAPGTGGRLRSTWMLLFRMAWDAEPEACPPDVRKRVLEAATEDVSRMRAFFASVEPTDAEAADRFLQRLGHFERCSKLLAQHGGLWRCMKPLLLALRSLRTPALARDLRYWDEFADDPPPKPWNAVPGLLNTLFHAYAGREQRSDPELEALRGHMAGYLLERLTDRWTKEQRAASNGLVRTDEDMVEPVPAWRYCMIRAVVDLKVNPEGRGHRALSWSSKNDPHPKVRDAARSAYQVLRHQRGLPQETSPRRAVMSALWWLKQAHLLGLGIQPDADGAQRTRAKELTRTKEVERDDSPAGT